VRRCIGASFAQFEMRVIMRTILERAQLRAAGPRSERSKLRNVTSAPARGCRVVLESYAPASSPSTASADTAQELARSG
jgi:cytochrome P450 family 135